nr:hypothetical protein [Tanacetum cinerariifolium]
LMSPKISRFFLIVDSLVVMLMGDKSRVLVGCGGGGSGGGGRRRIGGGWWRDEHRSKTGPDRPRPSWSKTPDRGPDRNGTVRSGPGCDVVEKAGISALVKCTFPIRQLAYAAVPDSLDEYLQISEKTSRYCLMHFCNGVIELYGEEYLRRPTQTDVEKLYDFHENKHGFPGMIGSIDCTKLLWAQCPQAYRAQFSRGDSGSEPFILLETVASQDLWIWHAFFGVAGSSNDVNVLRQFPVLNDLKVEKAPEVPFVANDVTYKWGYYLIDGIYPEWVVLMKSISQAGSNDVKRIRYKHAHEAARKDVERAFGVLKKK